ncbi:MAG: toxic anion resistance protein [Eubacteriaceae bacterium]|jgi:uncharacterized protein YaaN involved in tellurite resistance|nr:toxic anion resistance protein [Eubacteriaceae bacterium]
MNDGLEVTEFTTEEERQIAEFAQKVDLTNPTAILQYGSGAQKKMADFSESALDKVRTKDMGEVGGLLTDLTVELRGFGEPDAKGLKGLFKKGENKVSAMKAKYAKAEVNVNKIAEALESHQVVLMKDVATLDKLYDLNKQYFKELSMYIAAGKQKLDYTLSVELPALQQKAQQSGLPEDAQAANDLANMCNRFEKKLHDLELTRTISIQMAPQLRLVQGNDTEMSEKIQSTLVNTLPLWKSQMMIALGVAHSQEAAEAQRTVSDATNELLRRNADSLKMATIETAKESERGIVDMETLKHTNESLISTIDEVIRIQDEGHQKRLEAETELVRLEDELKTKLLDIRQTAGQEEQ